MKDDAEKAPTEASFDDELQRAKTQRTIAIASLAGGAALVVGGILRWTMFPATERVQVNATAGTSGGSVTVGWSF
jgi:hypothetical protein